MTQGQLDGRLALLLALDEMGALEAKNVTGKEAALIALNDPENWPAELRQRLAEYLP